MPEVRLLANWIDEKGEPQAAGAVINVSDEIATQLNNAGRASKLEDEKKLEDQQLTSGVYDSRLKRPDAPPGSEARAQPQRPQQPQPQQPARQEDQTKKR